MSIASEEYAKKQFSFKELDTTIKDIIVLDLEIQDPITNPKQWEETHKIKISCCVVYSFKDDTFRVYDYTMDDILNLRMRIIEADLVVGYNSNKFDLPVIFELPDKQLPDNVKTFDILAETWKALGLNPNVFTNLHRGYNLDAAARSTLGTTKFNHGSNAPQLFRNQQWGKLISYCLDDVRLTRNLFEHLTHFNELKFYRFGITVPVKFNFTKE